MTIVKYLHDPAADWPLQQQQTNIWFLQLKLEVSFIFWLQQWRYNDWNHITAKGNNKHRLLIDILIQLGNFQNKVNFQEISQNSLGKLPPITIKHFLKIQGPNSSNDKLSNALQN